jgi:hypothetical protein
MAFQSGVAEVGSGPHLALTWLVAIVLVTCVALFLGMLGAEIWRSARFAGRMAAARRALAVTKVGLAVRNLNEVRVWGCEYSVMHALHLGRPGFPVTARGRVFIMARCQCQCDARAFALYSVIIKQYQ